ncbi:MAG: hypothetical protein GX039_01510, partial [Clostridia bacterium]|nr:hypothetical protein [Clostridia bacterium]
MKQQNYNSWRLIPALSLFVILLVYFAVQAVQAGGAEPGSSQDPLVTKSYVDNYVQSRSRELQDQLAALTRQINALEARLAALEGQAPKPLPQPGPSPAPGPAPAPGTGTE